MGSRYDDVAAVTSAALDSGVVSARPLGGGDVAESYRVELADGTTVFAKTHRDPPPGFFTTEAAGLRWLRAAGTLPVPDVLAVSDEPPVLVLEWIDEAGRAASDDAAFGRDLAALHAAGASTYGREDRRSTGSRRLPNEPCATWAEFYASQRLLPLVRLATDAGALSTAAIGELEAVAGRLDRFGAADEAPSRLHGDLWAGNRIVDTAGRSWLIDPACHGGHREFDLAMMRLFGGFGAEAFTAYEEVAPLADGWERRVPLHQLAPLVVHAIKFRGVYPAAVERALASLR